MHDVLQFASVNRNQLSLETRVNVLNRLGKFDLVYDVFFPMKHLNNDADIMEIMTKVQNHADFLPNRQLLSRQIEIFLAFGEIFLALQYNDVSFSPNAT